MRRATIFLTVPLLCGVAPQLGAQAVPEGSQATRVEMGYRRTPQLRIDPFRHAMIPHWGLVISGGALIENNAFDMNDLFALKFLSDENALVVGDFLDLISQIPSGSGFGGFTVGGAGLALSAPITKSLSVSLSAQARGYGTFNIDEDAVALLRDGNGARQDFSFGASGGSGIATTEFGIHGVYRTPPLGSPDGVNLVLGLGFRFVNAPAFARMRSLLGNGGVVRVTGDSIAANLDIEVAAPIIDDAGDFFDRSTKLGSLAGDFLVRAEWPTSGLALEAALINVGSVSAEVERQRATLDIQATSVDDVNEVLDTLELAVQDTAEVRVSLPRIWRFSASGWANRILQLDVSATAPITGEFESPLVVELGSTWRFVRSFPLRAGVILGGRQGFGYSGGLAIESRNLLLQLAGQSLGGLFGNARGFAGRFELGFFF